MSVAPAPARILARGRVPWIVWAAWIVAWALVAPTVARADAVDEAFVEGNRAAAADDWHGGVRAYERAAGLLGERNAVVEYNLGTAYGHVGDLGRGTYYLQRSLQFESGPTPRVVERARANLQELRRRAELRAVAQQARIDRPASWWGLLLDGFRAPWVGGIALAAGLLLLLGLVVERRRRGRRGRGGVLQAALVVLAVVYLVAGALHGLALRAEGVAPRGVVLGEISTARARPGPHAEVAFDVVGGAQVRLLDHAPGWVKIRLPGALEGWLPEEAVGALSSPRPLLPRRRRADPGSRGAAPAATPPPAP